MTKPYRLLIVINGLITGGAEKLVLDIIPKLIERSVDVELLLLNGNEFPFLKELKKNSHCRIHSLSSKSYYNPLFIFRIAPFLKRFDLIHVHLFPALYWVGLAKILSFSKTKLIFTEHSTFNRRRNKLFTAVERSIYRQFEKVIVISTEVKKRLQAHLTLSDDKIVMIENGVDLKKIYDAEPVTENFFPDEPNKKILIQVARFLYPKDQQTVIRAIKRLPDNIKLVLVGDGEKRKECSTLADELGVSHRVKFLGVRHDVPSLLKKSDIVVLSSHYEGLSLASIEGLASGRLFIAY